MGMSEVQDRGFVTTTVDTVVNWARTGSMWPMTSSNFMRASSNASKPHSYGETFSLSGRWTPRKAPIP